LGNVGNLNDLPANTELTPETLVEHGIIRRHNDSVRILGNGELTVALKVSAHHFSQGAIDKIQGAGGNYTVIQPHAPTRNPKNR
jgi:large subunit ribosomal protein L15